MLFGAIVLHSVTYATIPLCMMVEGYHSIRLYPGLIPPSIITEQSVDGHEQCGIVLHFSNQAFWSRFVVLLSFVGVVK